jgi:hypothetical protein
MPASVVPDYETVAASQTAQVLGGTGGQGDFLSHLVIVPAAASGVGAVTIIDGSTSITVFVGGTLPSPASFTLPLLLYAETGPWKITTGSGVSVIAAGNFTA